MSRDRASRGGPNAPIRAGHVPQPERAGALGLALGACLAAGAGTGCSNSASDQVTMPVDLGMTPQLGAYFTGQDLTLYQVATPVQLPVRKPTAAEVKSLATPPKNTPYPTTPFVLASDETVEVRYTISNLDAQENTIWMLIDPWNEFVRYDPGVQVVSDEETSPNYGYDLVFIVPAKSRVSGTLTGDDTHEIAIKLASVMNLLASPLAQPTPGGMNAFDATGVANNIFNPQNRSNSNDPIYSRWIPPVIAGMTGFTLGLRYRCGAQCQPPNMAIEITVDVHDLEGNHFVEASNTSGQMGAPPKVLSPPAARF